MVEVKKHLSREELAALIREETDPRIKHRLNFIQHLYDGDEVSEAASKVGYATTTGYNNNTTTTTGWVCHLASLASPVFYRDYPIKTLKVGALGMHKTLGLAREKDASYLFTSTSEVYGDPEVNHQPEDYRGNVDPYGPRSCYDESKRYGESLVRAYRDKHGLDVRVARIFNTYGPRMRLDDGRVIPNFMRQALTGEDLTVYGDGEQTRSFCYVSDMIDGMVALMESEVEVPVNIGNSDERTILELAELIIDLTGSDSGITHEPLPPQDPDDFVTLLHSNARFEVLEVLEEFEVTVSPERGRSAVGGC